MSITNQQNISQVQTLYPAIDAGGLFRLANDGDTQACQKIASGEGGADFVCTALTTAADTVTFLIPWLSILKLYAAQQSNVTSLTIKARVWSHAALVANSYFSEVVATFMDNGGTMTIVGAQVETVANDGGTNAAPALSVATTNLSVVCVQTGAVAHDVRAEIFVTQAY